MCQEIAGGGRCHVFDDGEGRQKKDCGWAIGGEDGVVRGGRRDRHVGGRKHEALGNAIFSIFEPQWDRTSHTPFFGLIPDFPTASITLPFSSSTSRTQSVFPVATNICVAQPFT